MAASVDSVGVGKSRSHDAHVAGREAAEQAFANMPGGRVDLVLVFATAAYEQDAVLRGVTSVSGATPLSGCSTSGVITRAGSDESTHVVAVMALAARELSFSTYLVAGLSVDARRCGEELARRIREHDGEGTRVVLLFPDGLTGNVTDLLRAIEARLPGEALVAGGTAGELLKMTRTWQYHDGAAVSDAVAAVAIGGRVRADARVTHGCEPIGAEQVVTRAEDGWIVEIDGRSAWSVYRQYLDVQDVDTFTMAHTCYICLAQRLPEPDPDYGEYVIRCPLQLDKEAGKLFFPGNIETGARVRMALRSRDAMVSRALASAERIVADHPDERPFLVLIFDCCCRASLYFGAHTTEATIGPIEAVFGADVPCFGFHTYGEIGPLQGRPCFHNYSAVICALYAAPDG